MWDAPDITSSCHRQLVSESPGRRHHVHVPCSSLERVHLHVSPPRRRSRESPWRVCQRSPEISEYPRRSHLPPRANRTGCHMLRLTSSSPVCVPCNVCGHVAPYTDPEVRTETVLPLLPPTTNTSEVRKKETCT